MYQEILSLRVFSLRVFPLRVFPLRVFPLRVYPLRVFPLRVFPNLLPGEGSVLDNMVPVDHIVGYHPCCHVRIKVYFSDNVERMGCICTLTFLSVTGDLHCTCHIIF